MGRLWSAWAKNLRSWANHLRWQTWRDLRPNRREGIALIILLIPVGIGGVLALIDQPSRATLAVEELTPSKRLMVTAGEGDGSGVLQGRAAIVKLNEFSLGDGEAGSSSRKLQLTLPIPLATCFRLRAEIGGTCNGVGERATRAADALTVVWPSRDRFVVEAEESKRLNLRPTPVAGAAESYGALNLSVDAPVTKVSFECTERAGFQLVFDGHVVPLRCAYGPAGYRLDLTYDSPLAPKLFLTGLGPWQFEGAGAEAKAWVDRGSLWVDGSRRPLGAAGTPVVIAADGVPQVSTRVGNLDSGKRVGFTVDAESADSVEVSDHQALRSRLSKYENYWLLIIGIVGGVFLAIYLERVPVRD